MSLAQRFYDLFKGSDIAHGTYVVKSSRSTDGKKQGQATVLREPTTVDMWEEHLKGSDPGLGIVPTSSTETRRPVGVLDNGHWPMFFPTRFVFFQVLAILFFNFSHFLAFWPFFEVATLSHFDTLLANLKKTGNNEFFLPFFSLCTTGPPQI